MVSLTAVLAPPLRGPGISDKEYAVLLGHFLQERFDHRADSLWGDFYAQGALLMLLLFSVQ